ncbi:MAG: hypothetical protein HY922_14940 [Elusimicrobia bacterium]|nr:hypothetical protein [Elusimicrobiota bacterium]
MRWALLAAIGAVIVVLGLAAVARRGTASSVSTDDSSAFGSLLNSVPAGQREDISGGVGIDLIEAGPVDIPGASTEEPSAKAIPPGKDLLPKFSDRIRVDIILKIVAAVYNGAPLPFPKDGVVFENREGRLPAKPKGYYREYTVLPPKGSPMTVTVGDRTFQISPPQGHRGAERLIIGGGEVLYYSPDHYRTFIELQVIR